MGRGKCIVRESILRRVISAARKERFVCRIRIDRSGTIELVPASADDQANAEIERNDWDDLA
jgi:hypothetical protein